MSATSLVSPPHIAALSRWLRNAPRLVAEALRPVELPLATALRAGPLAPAPAVARAIARALAPEEADDPSPAWLRPGQDVAFRRALAAVRRYGGALLADPVGSGKTWVALAVGAALAREGGTGPGGVTCLVPASLQSQWREALQRTGVAGVISTLQLASRGRLPASRGPVVIDESHHLRTAATRRYAHVADWVRGRPLLLLSATPVVNRSADLGRQLRLGVRDDALAAHGLASLSGLGPAGHMALGALVVARSAVENLPGERPSRVQPGAAPALGALVAGIDRLRLSADPGVAALLRTGLVRALASSPRAFAGALARYQALLLQARDAHAAGRIAGRAVLRAVGGGDATQLVMWGLFPQSEAEWELALDDAPALGDLLQAARSAAAAGEGDPRTGALEQLLGDQQPTVVFAAYRDTTLALRDRLPRAAWVTGSQAGIGPARTGRAAALAPFRRAEGPCGREPRVLLATDVAAEGLDLRGASRVVHFDLPWTDVRLVQRAGRARRLGARHAVVEVVTFAPPPALERRLRLADALERKRSLGARIVDAPPWRWTAALAELAAGGTEVGGGVGVVPVAEGAEAGALAGLVIEEVGEERRVVTAWLGWRPHRERRCKWTTSREAVAPRLAALLAEAGVAPAVAASRAALPRLGPILADLAGEAARLLRRASAAQLGAIGRTPGAASLSRRLLAAAAEARRARDAGRLSRLEAWLAFLARGHTAGEARLVERLAGGAARDEAFNASPPPGPGAPGRDRLHPRALRVRLTGLVVFDAGGC